jgi:hypothetical protein
MHQYYCPKCQKLVRLTYEDKLKLFYKAIERKQ